MRHFDDNQITLTKYRLTNWFDNQEKVFLKRGSWGKHIKGWNILLQHSLAIENQFHD